VHYFDLSGFWQCGPVEEMYLARFTNGRSLQLVDHPESQYAPEEIVRRARARLAENANRLLQM
jgi:hypothetical protein